MGTYMIIATLIFVSSMIIFCKKDGEIKLINLIQNITEALIVSIGWIYTVPILVISNILLIVVCLCTDYDDEEED